MIALLGIALGVAVTFLFLAVMTFANRRSPVAVVASIAMPAPAAGGEAASVPVS